MYQTSLMTDFSGYNFQLMRLDRLNDTFNSAEAITAFKGMRIC